MDIRELIQLSGQAAECVLRFRATAFTPRPFIDSHSFKNIIRASIRRSAREDLRGSNNALDDVDEIPLASATAVAGTAAFRAAKKWNDTADKVAHIDPEWFRHCVSDLVSGVVTSAALQQAHHHHHPYLDPLAVTANNDDDDDDDDDVFDFGRPPHRARAGAAPRRRPELSYYGFETRTAATNPAQPPGMHQHPPQQRQPLLPRHAAAVGWSAINKLAADPFSADAAVEFQDSVAAVIDDNSNHHHDDDDDEDALLLPRKRASPSPCYPSSSSSGDDDDEDDGDSRDTGRALLYEHPRVVLLASKRPRLGSLSAASTPPRRRGAALLGGGGGRGRGYYKCSWTKPELDALVEARDAGKDWDSVHELVPTRSRQACQKKFYDIVKERLEMHGGGGSGGGGSVLTPAETSATDMSDGGGARENEFGSCDGDSEDI